MSIFDGRIREFPDLFVDNFSTSFLNFGRRQVFFLSHAHSDHMRGLDSTSFKDQFLAHPRASFFASVETKELLLRQRKYRDIAAAIISKNINETFTISLGLSEDDAKGDGKRSVDCVGAKDATGQNHGVKGAFASATLLPAQHCPGSVSIYLADCHNEVRVLYTGDFRWEEPQYRDFSFLLPFLPINAALTNLYLDTTFCSDETLTTFPSRLQVASKVLEEISTWFKEDSNMMKNMNFESHDIATNKLHSSLRLVHFNSKSRCGHEKLFAFLSKKLSSKIHVNKERIAEYGNIPHVASIFTSDPSSTRLHACEDGSGCFSATDPNVLTITASTQWWTRGMGGAGVVGLSSTSDVLMERVSANHFRFLYSFHPSLEELRHLVSALKSICITPTAAAATTAGAGSSTVSSIEKMLRLLGAEEGVVRNFSQGSSTTSSQSSASSKGEKPSEGLCGKKKQVKPRRTSQDSWGLLFDSDEDARDIDAEKSKIREEEGITSFKRKLDDKAEDANVNDEEEGIVEGSRKGEQRQLLECSPQIQISTPNLFASFSSSSNERLDEIVENANVINEEGKGYDGEEGEESQEEEQERQPSEGSPRIPMSKPNLFASISSSKTEKNAEEADVNNDEGEEVEETQEEEQQRQSLEGSPRILVTKPNLFANISSSEADELRSSSPSSSRSKATSKSSTEENAAVRFASNNSMEDSILLTSNASCDISLHNRRTTEETAPDVIPSTQQPALAAISRREDETYCFKEFSPQPSSDLNQNNEVTRKETVDHEGEADLGDDDDDDLIIVSVVEGTKRRTTCSHDDDDERLLKMWRK